MKSKHLFFIMQMRARLRRLSLLSFMLTRPTDRPPSHCQAKTLSPPQDLELRRKFVIKAPGGGSPEVKVTSEAAHHYIRLDRPPFWEGTIWQYCPCTRLDRPTSQLAITTCPATESDQYFPLLRVIRLIAGVTEKSILIYRVTT